ncbi:hypothetical protein A0H76_2506 [Hepatospora eriocheir]|uniref:Uncharacterized protein n=1 Tax=Hepatospora eriocheir TaxID=1081669 RepID=A0A1X0QJT7_9MICR|nr:hypothetical protein A0H76_2506 [Hepatospora eriocheir]
MQMRKQRFETSYLNNFYLDNQPIIKNKRYNLNNNIPINNNSQFNNLPMNNMPVNSNNIPMNTGFNNFNNSYMPISNKKPNMHFININHPKNYKMMNFPSKMMMNRTMIPNLRPTREMEMNQKMMNVNNSQKRFNVNHYMMPQETFNPQFNPSFYGYNPKMDPRMIHKETANDPNQLKIKNSEFFQSPPLMHATKKTNCLTQMDIIIRDQKNKEKIAASSDRSRIKQSPHHKEKLKKRGRKPKNYENSLSGSNQGFQSIFKKKIDFDMTPEKWNALFDFKPVVITQPKLGDHIKARIINQKNKENKS